MRGLLLYALLAATAVAWPVWGQAGATPNKAGQSPYSLPTSTPLLVWNHTIDETHGGSTEPIITDSYAIVITFDRQLGVLAAVSLATGDIAWSGIVGPTLGVAQPAVAGSTLYFFNSTAKAVVALTLDTWAEQWRHDNVTSVKVSSLTVDGDSVYCQLDGRLVRLSRATGDEVWSQSIAQFVKAPAVGAGVVVVSHSDLQNVGTVFACEQGTGKLRWAFHSPTLGALQTEPVIYGSRVYVGADTTGGATSPGIVVSIDINTGDQAFAKDMEGYLISGPAVTCDGILFGGHDVDTGPGQLLAMDSVSGDLVWAYNADESVITTASLDGNGGVLVAVAPKKLIRIDIESGGVTWALGLTGHCFSNSYCGGVRRPAIGPNMLVTVYGATVSLYTTDGNPPQLPQAPLVTCSADSGDNPNGSSQLAVVIWVTVVVVALVGIGGFVAYKKVYAPRFGDLPCLSRRGGGAGVTSSEYAGFDGEPEAPLHTAEF